MVKPRLLLIGAGGHAASCIDVIEQEGRYDIAGLVGQRHELGKRVLGYEVVGTDENLADLKAMAPFALVTIGQIKSAEVREAAFSKMLQAGFEAASVVSPHAYFSQHAQLGHGSIVMHGAIVNASAVVGDNTIVNTKSLLEHGAQLGSHCHLSTGAIVNGDTVIDEGCFIGSGAIVREGLRIGRRCFISMGARVSIDLGNEVRVR